MDNNQFDGMVKVLALGVSRRGAAAGVAGLAALALGAPGEVAERHKRKKKKKRCMRAQQACQGKRCCGGLHCGDNGCAGASVCHHDEGGSCSEDCDCAEDLNCSERHDDTCQYCGYPETLCTFTSDCCLKDSICGYNGCEDYDTVCCQWEIGSFCYDDCDCCAELGCFGNACLPLLHEDGVTPRVREGGAAPEQLGKGHWPRRAAAAR
jgi:hypothetical protein